METAPRPSGWRIAVIAARPFAFSASVVPVVVGLALARQSGAPVHIGLFFLTLLGVLCFHTAANLLNDCMDHRRGLDTEILPTSGAIVRGWLSERQVLGAAFACLLAGVMTGLILTWACGWTLLVLGLVGTLITISYTLPGYCFKYHALGDPALFLAFGLLPVTGSYWVQTGAFAAAPLFWSVPVGCLTVAILHANNWRDRGRDRDAGCRTLAGIMGERGSRIYYQVLVLGPFVLVAVAMGLQWRSGGAVPGFLALPMGALPLALSAARVTPASLPVLDTRTARLNLSFGLLLALGLWLNR